MGKGKGAIPKGAGKPSNKGVKKASLKTAATGKGSKLPKRGVNRG